MIPKGTLWQVLRGVLLDAVPSDSANYSRPRPLALWHETGSYSVVSILPQSAELTAAPDDIGTTLLSDAQLLLEHAAEHRALAFAVANSSAWTSPAWLAVTVYYWAYFSALATTRLLGDTVWYLDADAASTVAKLAPVPPSRSFGSGSYRLSLGPTRASADRAVLLRRSKDRLHEAVWKAFFGKISELLAKHAPLATDMGELQLYQTLIETSRRFTPDWPSAVRNIVNYRVGFGYREVRRKSDHRLEKFLRRPLPLGAVVEELNSSANAASGLRDLLRENGPYPQVLGSLAILAHAIVTELHSELVARNRGLQHWNTVHTRFLRDRGLIDERGAWPVRPP